MDNMQDILKSYYANGGKTLFENQTLLEYNQATTISKWGDKIILAAWANSNTNNSDGWFAMENNRFGPWMEVLTKGAPLSEYPEYQKQRQKFLTDFLTELEKIDPTENNQYVMWLVKSYCQSIKADAKHQADFEREADPAHVMMAGHYSEWALDLVADDDEDMHSNGNYYGTDWSIDYPSGLNSFRLEDSEQIANTLANYHRIKPQLPVQQRDINRFKTVKRLEDFVDDIMDGKTIDKPETDSEVLKRSDVEVIYNGPLGTVTIPRSFEASCVLGSGTKWCTTGKNSDYYNIYSEKGDLIIYNEKPGNNKYQIHQTLDSTEIMDARDRPVSGEKFREFTGSHPVLSKLIKQKQQEAFHKVAQTDPEWDIIQNLEYLDDMIERVYLLIDMNNKQRVGVMTYVETYYTQEFFRHRDNKRKYIVEYKVDYLVKYAQQRGKPWPEIQPLAVEYIQQRYQDLPTDASIEKFKAKYQTPSFPADAKAAQDIKDIRKQAQATFKTGEAKQLLILIKQFKRLKNPWPELDAIQAQLEGSGTSNTPDDMNIETLDLSDIRIKYSQ